MSFALTKIYIIFTILHLFFASSVYASALKPTITHNSSDRYISDISSWHHPTKKIFKAYGITLRSIELRKKIATFNVIFPFDPMTSENWHLVKKLCYELLEANGMWNYSLRSEKDQIQIQVSWNKYKRSMSFDFIHLK